MPVTLPIDVYEIFESSFGKEGAKKVVKSIEAVIEGETVNKWHQTKTELKEELLKEVATKKDLEIVRTELLGIMQKDKTELLGIMQKDKTEIEGKIEKLNMKLNFLIVLVIIALTLMNPVAAEIIKSLFKL
jgi:hypothetical protein